MKSLSRLGETLSMRRTIRGESDTFVISSARRENYFYGAKTNQRSGLTGSETSRRFHSSPGKPGWPGPAKVASAPQIERFAEKSREGKTDRPCESGIRRSGRPHSNAAEGAHKAFSDRWVATASSLLTRQRARAMRAEPARARNSWCSVIERSSGQR